MSEEKDKVKPVQPPEQEKGPQNPTDTEQVSTEETVSQDSAAGEKVSEEEAKPEKPVDTDQDSESQKPAESGKEPIPPEAAIAEQGPEWVAELDTYPLREKSDDPKWAIRTVWIWIGIALACIAGILLLLILGAIYD